MKKILYSGAFAVAFASFLWSLDGLLRRVLYDMPPSVVVFWEHVLGLIVILPFVLRKRSEFKKLTKKQWISIGVVALLSGMLGSTLYTAALGQVQYIPYSVVVLLQQLNPVFAIAMAALFLREKLTKKFIFLAIVALVGAYMTAFPDLVVNFDSGTGTILAALLAVGAAASWGTATAFSKYALEGTSFLHITAIRFALAPVFALLFTIGTGQISAITSLSLEQFGYLMAITFSTGLVALVIYYYGLQRIAASEAAVLGLVRPLAAVIIGWVFLSQGLTLTQALGAGLLLMATVMVARSKEGRDTGPDV